MEGMYLDDCPEFEMWLLTKREAYRSQVVTLLQTLFQQCVATNRHVQAIEVAWQLLRLEPWCEAIHRQLMMLLAHIGRHEAALRQYRLCQRMLAEELDLEPSPETVALYQRIRRSLETPAQRPSASPAPRALPNFEVAMLALA
jgi:DNA-binding SARP family transcriptional activator